MEHYIMFKIIKKEEWDRQQKRIQNIETLLADLIPIFKSVQDFGFPTTSGLYSVIGQQILEGTSVYFNGQAKWDSEKHLWQPQNFYVTGILNVISWKEVTDL